MRELDVPADPLQIYDAALSRGDTAAVTELVADMLASGSEPVSVLTDVVAAAQREVGKRWQRGEWSVAEEHAATAMAISATKVVAEHVRRTPVTRGSVIVACAEREWHALPAMIIDCALRSDGWDTTLLGASTSPMRLNQYLQDLGPEAVAVSCSVLGSLPTCRRFIEASTASGVPILVGGPAFGPDDVRARALGATAWARDALRGDRRHDRPARRGGTRRAVAERVRRRAGGTRGGPPPTGRAATGELVARRVRDHGRGGLPAQRHGRRRRCVAPDPARAVRRPADGRSPPRPGDRVMGRGRATDPRRRRYDAARAGGRAHRRDARLSAGRWAGGRATSPCRPARPAASPGAARICSSSR